MNGFPLIKLPGVEFVTFRDLVLKLHEFSSKVPDLAFVIVACRRGDTENMRLLSSLGLRSEEKREMIAKVADAMKLGTVQAE